jgi:hypothetical protein
MENGGKIWLLHVSMVSFQIGREREEEEEKRFKEGMISGGYL